MLSTGFVGQDARSDVAGLPVLYCIRGKETSSWSIHIGSIDTFRQSGELFADGSAAAPGCLDDSLSP
jgi:hypothetical protein